MDSKVLNDKTNRDPVNIQAARLFWKSPYWAKVEVDDSWKARMNTRAGNLTQKEYEMHTRPPPITDGRTGNRRVDRRGLMLDFVLSSPRRSGLVIGFARSTEKSKKRKKKISYNNGTFLVKKTIIKRVPAYKRYWFVLTSESEIITVCLGEGQSKGVKIIESSIQRRNKNPHGQNNHGFKTKS